MIDRGLPRDLVGRTLLVRSSQAVRLGFREPRGRDPHELLRGRRSNLGPHVRQVVLDGQVGQAEPAAGRLPDPVASTAATSLTSRSVARWGWARRQSRHAHWNHSEGSGNPEARIETGRSSVAERFPLSSRAASHLANSRRVRPAEQVRGLADIDAARSTVQPREVLPGRRLADLQLVGGTGERARRDVGPQDLELAPGGALTDGGRHTHSARRPVAAWRSSESG